jgi:holo-[acyl-carrier protein] synthase
MQYVGVDIIEINRIKSVITRWGDKFLKRVFTPSELANYSRRISSLAARFAAKEAALKALDACDMGISWHEIEILSEPNGKPNVILSGKAMQAASQLNLKELAVSLSHSDAYAVAFVVGISG